jgi:hypothetical protein
VLTCNINGQSDKNDAYGVLCKLLYAVFCLTPCHARSYTYVPVTRILNHDVVIILVEEAANMPYALGDKEDV